MAKTKTNSPGTAKTNMGRGNKAILPVVTPDSTIEGMEASSSATGSMNPAIPPAKTRTGKSKTAKHKAAGSSSSSTAIEEKRRLRISRGYGSLSTTVRDLYEAGQTRQEVNAFLGELR